MSPHCIHRHMRRLNASARPHRAGCIELRGWSAGVLLSHHAVRVIVTFIVSIVCECMMMFVMLLGVGMRIARCILRTSIDRTVVSTTRIEQERRGAMRPHAACAYIDLQMHVHVDVMMTWMRVWCDVDIDVTCVSLRRR
jgi:hypothetical protein